MATDNRNQNQKPGSDKSQQKDANQSSHDQYGQQDKHGAGGYGGMDRKPGEHNPGGQTGDTQQGQKH